MTKTRSRAYPAISLEEAHTLFLNKLSDLDAKPHTRKEVAIVLGYSSSSGGIAGRKVAALVQYGFIERHAKKYTLSSFGVYIRSLKPEDPDLGRALKTAFSRPPLFREIVDAYVPFGELPTDLRELLESRFRIAPKVCPQVEDLFVTSAIFANVLSAGRKFITKEDQQRLIGLKRRREDTLTREPRLPDLRNVHELRLEDGESVVEWRFPMPGGDSSFGVALTLPPDLTEPEHAYISKQLPRIADSLRELRPPVSSPGPQPLATPTKQSSEVFLDRDTILKPATQAGT